MREHMALNCLTGDGAREDEAAAEIAKALKDCEVIASNMRRIADRVVHSRYAFLSIERAAIIVAMVEDAQTRKALSLDLDRAMDSYRKAMGEFLTLDRFKAM